MEKSEKSSLPIENEKSVVIVNYVGVLFGLLVLALTAVKPNDFKDVFLYLQFEYSLAVYFLLMSIVIGFWFILGITLDIWNRIMVIFRIKGHYPYYPEYTRVLYPRWTYNLLNLMYWFFWAGIIVVASIIVLMVSKSLWLNFIFLCIVVVSLLFVFYYIDRGE